VKFEFYLNFDSALKVDMVILHELKMVPNGLLIKLPSLLRQCSENNNNSSVLFIVCTADHYYMKTVDKFHPRF